MSTKHTQIAAEVRTIIGKQVRQLRRAGLIPAVIYGRRDPISIQLNALQTTLALRDAADNAIVDLDLGGEIYTALVRDLQRHATRRNITHIDFLEVSKDQMVQAEVSLVLAGQMTFPGYNSGNAQLLLQSVQVEAKPDDLVAEIEVNLAKLVSPDTVLMVSDLDAPAGLIILTDGDIAVAKFEFERTAAQDEADDAAEAGHVAEPAE
jgi:large subunit ribosomal protein L25